MPLGSRDCYRNWIAALLFRERCRLGGRWRIPEDVVRVTFGTLLLFPPVSRGFNEFEARYFIATVLGNRVKRFGWDALA